MEPNRLQSWNTPDNVDFPQMWTEEMIDIIVKSINPGLHELYEGWQHGRDIGTLWADLGALHCCLIQFKGIHALTVGRPIIWSFMANPTDFQREPTIRFQLNVLDGVTIFGMEGGPNPWRCTFRDIATHTGIIENLDNMSFHCASKGFAEAAAIAIFGRENR